MRRVRKTTSRVKTKKPKWSCLKVLLWTEGTVPWSCILCSVKITRASPGSCRHRRRVASPCHTCLSSELLRAQCNTHNLNPAVINVCTIKSIMWRISICQSWFASVPLGIMRCEARKSKKKKKNYLKLCMIASWCSSMLLLCAVGKDIRRAQASGEGISFFLCWALKPRFYCVILQLCRICGWC